MSLYTVLNIFLHKAYGNTVDRVKNLVKEDKIMMLSLKNCLFLIIFYKITFKLETVDFKGIFFI